MKYYKCKFCGRVEYLSLGDASRSGWDWHGSPDTPRRIEACPSCMLIPENLEEFEKEVIANRNAIDKPKNLKNALKKLEARGGNEALDAIKKISENKVDDPVGYAKLLVTRIEAERAIILKNVKP